MFCAHLLQDWHALQLLPGWDLFYGRYDQPISCSHSFEDYQLNINGNTNSIRNSVKYMVNKQLHLIYHRIHLYDCAYNNMAIVIVRSVQQVSKMADF